MTDRSDAALERLRAVRTAHDLLRYFIEELNWPLYDEAMLEDEDLDDLTFEWDLGELGVPTPARDLIQRVRQVRPFIAHQPWGIFFVELSGSRLLITQLRRILHSLVRRRRATRDADLRSWDLDDLIFVVTTGEFDSTKLHLLVFFDVNGKAKFHSLSWQAADSTRRLRRLADELLPQLEWPDDEENVQAWRRGWRKPFTLEPGERIRSAACLADRMSRTARDLRGQINEALSVENGKGPFSTLMRAVREQLVPDVNEDGFADICAQTLVYGLLGSRVSDPDGFGATPVLSVIPLSNPFLSAFFQQVHGEAVGLDLEGSGLSQLAAALQRTDFEAILDDFGSTAKGGDPVIHFYEEFLKKYDRKKRADAGAFYTPAPVVEFMVRAVDELLRSRFGLEAGVADASTWAEVAERVGFDVPEEVDPDRPFVSMIDPAAGTGTFLVHWLRQAKRSFTHAYPGKSLRRHLGERVLPTMHAFELMLGPYTVAHLKLALLLHDEGLTTDDTKILLTDTLAHDPPQPRLGLMEDPVAVQGQHASQLKKYEPFTVVIGNPPYDREQRAVGDTGTRKGGVVRHGAPSLEPLITDMTQPMVDAGLGLHLKNMYNDYVYFWRWATWQATELSPGPGIVAFITPSSYLDGISMGGVRSLLRKAFDELLIVDIGGEGRGALVEQNVFEIRTPVAIAFGVRTRLHSPSCVVKYLRIPGGREEKFETLKHLRLSDISSVVPGFGLDSFLLRSNEPYWSWPSLTDLFPWIRSGCKYQRTWPIGETPSVLNSRWRRLVEAVPRDRGPLLKEKDRTVHSRRKGLLDNSDLKPIYLLDIDDQPESIERYGFRSFDRQWAIADNRLAGRPAPILWRIHSDKQLFLTTLTSTKLGKGPAVTVTPYIPDLHHFSGRGARNVIPLYRDAATRVPNLPEGLLERLSSAVRKPLSLNDLLAYIHALLGTGAFTDRFAEQLDEIARPVRIPITTNPKLFSQAIAIGQRLLWYHTWGERAQPEALTPLPHSNTLEISPINRYPKTFRYVSEDQLLEVGTGSFGPVSPEVWEFEVSGLKVVRSWLGYRMAKRKGRKSSPLDDIRPQTWIFSEELIRLITILQYTIDVTPTAAQLLDEIVAGPLIMPEELPQPTDAERKAPRP